TPLGIGGRAGLGGLASGLGNNFIGFLAPPDIPVLDEELFQHGTDSGDLRFGPSPSDPLTPIIGNRLFSAVVVVKQKAVGPMLQQRQVAGVFRVVAQVPLVIVHPRPPASSRQTQKCQFAITYWIALAVAFAFQRSMTSCGARPQCASPCRN